MIPLQLDSYNKITDSLEDPVVSFLEGNPRAVADWVEMQFTDEVINEYLPIIDQFKHGLLGISEHAVHLIESGRLDRTLSNFDRLNIIEPPEYSMLIGKEGILSPHHLAISLILLNSVKGRGNIYNLIDKKDISTFASHWIRLPAVTASIPGEISTSESEDYQPMFLLMAI